MITTVGKGLPWLWWLKHKCMNHDVLMEAICNWTARLQTFFHCFFLSVIVISKWFKNLMLYKFIMKMDLTSLHIWGRYQITSKKSPTYTSSYNDCVFGCKTDCGLIADFIRQL